MFSAPFNLIAAFVLSFLAETMTEYFASPVLKPAKPASRAPGDPPDLILRYIAAGVGLILCLAYRVDLLAMVGIGAQWPWIGYVITGLIVGRGSNFVHDFATRWLA